MSGALEHSHNVADPELLDRAALEGRVLVSHDRRTMIDHFRARLTVDTQSWASDCAAGRFHWRRDSSFSLHLGTIRSG